MRHRVARRALTIATGQLALKQRALRSSKVDKAPGPAAHCTDWNLQQHRCENPEISHTSQYFSIGWNCYLHVSAVGSLSLRQQTGECHSVHVPVLLYPSGQAWQSTQVKKGDRRPSPQQQVGLGVVNFYDSKHRNYTNTWSSQQTHANFRPGFVMQQATELRTVHNSQHFLLQDWPLSILSFSLKDALMCPNHTDVTDRVYSGTEFPGILKIRGTW